VEILKQRIYYGLNSHLDTHSQTKMFVLIREIEFLLNSVENWAKGYQRKTHRSKHENVECIYP
jgi:hypothetical protein